MNIKAELARIEELIVTNQNFIERSNVRLRQLAQEREVILRKSIITRGDVVRWGDHEDYFLVLDKSNVKRFVDADKLLITNGTSAFEVDPAKLERVGSLIAEANRGTSNPTPAAAQGRL